MTTENLDSLYQEIILDHYKNPHHAGLRHPFEVEVHHVNPTCGDEVTVRVHLSGTDTDAVIEDVSYDAEGCSISQVLDSRGIAVRAGHHCAKPAHRRFGVQSSTRMSSYLYTTPAEIDALVDGLEYTRSYFKLG